MYIIAGLGNPGRQYEGTRHNMGFDTADYLIDRGRIPYSGITMHAMYGKGILEGQKVIIIKPVTFMNLSGQAVREFVNYYKIDPASELIVIYDDISLDPGQIRVRKKGSAGGHNGMKSIIEQLGTDQFTRIRMGVGARPKAWDLADHVLSRFSPEDRILANEAIEHAADAVACILRGETDEAMNRYNRKAEKPDKEEKKAGKQLEKEEAKAARKLEKEESKAAKQLEKEEFRAAKQLEKEEAKAAEPE